MSTYTQIFYHLVFSTKDREPVLHKESRDDLYRFIWGVLKTRECHLHRIGGVEDHVHMLISLHPAIALSDLVKEIKTAASKWIKGTGAFPNFSHWQPGYGAFTHALSDKDDLIEYIKGQEEHHKQVSFHEEYEALLRRAGLSLTRDMTFDEDLSVEAPAARWANRFAVQMQSHFPWVDLARLGRPMATHGEPFGFEGGHPLLRHQPPRTTRKVL